MKIVYKESFVERLEKQLRYIAKDKPTAVRRFKKDLIAKIKTSLQIQNYSENQYTLKMKR